MEQSIKYTLIALLLLAASIPIGLLIRRVLFKSLDRTMTVPKGMWIRDKKGKRHYVYLKKESSGIVIESVRPTPSYHGENCLGNGEYKKIARQCDTCEHYQTCFIENKEENAK